MQKNKFFPLFFLFGIVFLIFWQFFIRQQVLFPGGFMLAWFEPWKTDHIVNGVIQIIHKPVASDVFRQFYPFKTLAIDILKTFQLPLWNPYNGAGMPLLATINIGLLDPFNVLFFFLSYSTAWTVYIIFQCIFISYSVFLYCKKIKLSTYAALFSAVVFLFSGVVVVRIPYSIFGTAFALLPFGLYILEDYIQNASKKIFLFPIVISILLISTLPQISLYILFFHFAYVFFRLLSQKNKTKLLVIITFFILGFGLVGFQLIPTAELFLNANMTTQASSFIFQKFLLPPQHIISLFIPNFFGSDATYNYWGYGDYVETVLYLGTIPCLFIIFTFFKSLSTKNSISVKKFYFWTALITLLLSFNWFLPTFLFSLQIPLLSTGVPSRIFLLTTFSLCIVAGLGFDSFFFSVKKETLKIKILLSFLSFIISFILLLFLLNKLHLFPCKNGAITNCATIALRNTILETSILCFSAIALIGSLFVKRRLGFFSFFIIIVVSGIGLFNTYKFLPFSPKNNVMPTNSLISYISSLPNERIFGLGQANIATDFATYYKFYDPNYYHPLYIKRYGELISYANTGNFEKGLLRSDVEITKDIAIDSKLLYQRERLFNLLGVGSIIYKKNEAPKQTPTWQDKNWIVMKNLSMLPRAYIVPYMIVKNNSTAILQTLFDSSFNIHNTVILEKNIPGFVPSQNLISNASIVSYSPNQVILKTTTSNKGLLVLTDNYYPGWQATIDGKQVPIFRANYSFRAIVLPNGLHKVLFTYQPFSLTLGIIISAVSFLLYSMFFVIKKLRNLFVGNFWPKICR